MDQQISRPTPEQLNAWKAKHGNIFAIEVDDKQIILRNPKMADIERAAASDPTGKKPFNFNRSILNNCTLYSDPGMLEDDGIVRAVYSQLDQIIEITEAHVKKL